MKFLKEFDGKCCDSPNPVINIDSAIVCSNCGTVLKTSNYSNKKRAVYTPYQIRQRTITEPVLNPFGPRTSFQLNEVTGIVNFRFFKNLLKIHHSNFLPLESNLKQAFPKLNKYCYMLHIPDYVKQDAWKIYNESAIQKLTMGRSIIAFVAGSLYTAIRANGITIDLKTVVSISSESMRNINRAVTLIKQIILPKLNFSCGPIKISEFIIPLGSQLKIPFIYQKKAYNFFIILKRNGLIINGKDPNGIIAAMYYILLTKNKVSIKGQKFTQKYFADNTGVTEVTIRNNLKSIKKITNKIETIQLYNKYTKGSNVIG